MIDEVDKSDIMKAFRKQNVEKGIDDAVSRVLSVVDSPDARQQYRRLLAMYQCGKVLSFLCKQVKMCEMSSLFRTLKRIFLVNSSKKHEQIFGALL